jgi:hypothetical protein
MKINLTKWLALILVTTSVYFTPVYCDEAPESPGDSGVTDAVTPRFAKPGKIVQDKNMFSESAKAAELKKTPEPAAAGNTKKAEAPKQDSVIDKLKNMFRINKADSAKNAQDPKTVETDKK